MPNGKYVQKGYKYECLKCGDIDYIPERNLNNGQGCNVCCASPRKVLKGYNDIWTTHPYIAKILKNIEDGYKISKGSSKKLMFTCPNCDYEKPLRVYSIVKQGFPCPRCNDGISYGNKFIRNLLEQLSENYIPEYSPDWAFIKHGNFKINGKKNI